jgi:hypothetical protein
MIRNNRKKDSFVFPVPLAGLVAVCTVLALTYVCLCCRCDAVGRDIRQLEAERAELEKQVQNGEYRWTKLKSPANMDRVLADLNIVMTWPRRDQVVYLPDPAAAEDEPLPDHPPAALTYVGSAQGVMND